MYRNEIKVGDIVVWQTVHDGRPVQTGRIGIVARIEGEMADVVDGSLTLADVDWNNHDVFTVDLAKLGKVNVTRYASILR